MEQKEAIEVIRSMDYLGHLKGSGVIVAFDDDDYFLIGPDEDYRTKAEFFSNRVKVKGYKAIAKKIERTVQEMFEESTEAMSADDVDCYIDGIVDECYGARPL